MISKHSVNHIQTITSSSIQVLFFSRELTSPSTRDRLRPFRIPRTLLCLLRSFFSSSFVTHFLSHSKGDIVSCRVDLAGAICGSFERVQKLAHSWPERLVTSTTPDTSNCFFPFFSLYSFFFHLFFPAIGPPCIDACVLVVKVDGGIVE